MTGRITLDFAFEDSDQLVPLVEAIVRLIGPVTAVDVTKFTVEYLNDHPVG